MKATTLQSRISAFLLLTTEDRDPQVRRVGYVYMASTRVGTLCLFAAISVGAVATGAAILEGQTAVGGLRQSNSERNEESK